MSVSTLAIANDVALVLGDQSFTRFEQADHLLAINRVCRELATELRLVQWEASFDVVAGIEVYALPADCVQMRSLRFSLTPSDITSFYKLGEMFEDEFESATARQYTSGDPTKYLARQGYFWLHPLPQATSVAGGRLLYWGLPDAVADLTTGVLPLPDFVRDLVALGVQIHALRKLEELEQAAVYEQEYARTMALIRDKIEDRSADRRSRVRTRVGGFGGQV